MESRAENSIVILGSKQTLEKAKEQQKNSEYEYLPAAKPTHRKAVSFLPAFNKQSLPKIWKNKIASAKFNPNQNSDAPYIPFECHAYAEEWTSILSADPGNYFFDMLQDQDLKNTIYDSLIATHHDESYSLNLSLVVGRSIHTVNIGETRAVLVYRRQGEKHFAAQCLTFVFKNQCERTYTRSISHTLKPESIEIGSSQITLEDDWEEAYLIQTSPEISAYWCEEGIAQGFNFFAEQLNRIAKASKAKEIAAMALNLLLPEDRENTKAALTVTTLPRAKVADNMPPMLIINHEGAALKKLGDKIRTKLEENLEENLEETVQSASKIKEDKQEESLEEEKSSPDSEEVKKQKLRECINLAILGRKNYNGENQEPELNVDSYFYFLNNHAASLFVFNKTFPFFINWNYFYHKKNGRKQAQELLKEINNKECSLEQMQNLVEEKYLQSGVRSHSLSRYLKSWIADIPLKEIQAFTDNGFAKIKQHPLCQDSLNESERMYMNSWRAYFKSIFTTKNSTEQQAKIFHKRIYTGPRDTSRKPREARDAYERVIREMGRSSNGFFAKMAERAFKAEKVATEKDKNDHLKNEAGKNNL
jgi:hypothetical protein